jgi:hypothetical protein
MTPEVTPPSAANPYDLIVLGVFFFSAAMGIYRGLTKEVLSIAAWVGAGLTATFCYLPFRDMFRGFISYVFIADIANILVVFVTSLVIMTMLISTVSEKIKHSKLGGLDRSLGCLFLHDLEKTRRPRASSACPTTRQIPSLFRKRRAHPLESRSPRSCSCPL